MARARLEFLKIFVLLRKGAGVYLKLCLYGGRAYSLKEIREGLLYKYFLGWKDLIIIFENICVTPKRGRGLFKIMFIWWEG